MSRRREAVYIALATLVGLYLFFIQFLPPIRRFHFIGDIEGYHYPLLNYAFKSLHEGRFPLWDPTIYCGLSFAGNVQAQLFYPLTWVLFACQWYRQGIAYMAIQIFALSHLWILLQFAYWWLRSGRGLPMAAALLGATTFALTGYLLNDFQHLGVICGLAWMPLALWGVDRRRVWMIAVAGALAFTAGYPATWIAIAVGVFFYALFTAWRYALTAGLGMLFSLLLAGIQLLPTAELARYRVAEQVYGYAPPMEWHLRRFYPGSLLEGQYLYYGAAFLIAIALALWNGNYRRYVPALGLAAAGLVFFEDPYDAVQVWASKIPSLLDVMQHWNFQAIFSAAVAWFVALAWTPLSKSHPRLVLALLPLFWFEQYWFGARRDNFREQSNPDRFFMGDARIGGKEMRGMDTDVFALLRLHPEFRVLSDQGPHGSEFRHYGLTVPNGFDPFVTTGFKAEIEQYLPFETNRLFRVPVTNEPMLKALGVRYVLSTRQSPHYQTLLETAYYRAIPTRGHFQVFEYLHAEPAYRFENGNSTSVRWTPEIREFRVSASQPGDFVLIEQNLPGWRAYIDEAEVAVSLSSKAFQKVNIVQPGEHTVRFEYRPKSVAWGGFLSLAAGIVLVGLARRRL